MGRRTKLNAKSQATIVAAIRAGAWDYVAAQAAGVDKATFWRWMGDERKLYSDFRKQVEEAHAQARITAEIEVRRDSPLAWLRMGPGRARKDAPGWTEGVEVTGADAGAIVVRWESDPDA